MKKPLISIIIPVKRINDYIRHEIIPSLEKQTFQNFELIILPDKKTKEKLKEARIIPTWPETGPAGKRDLGVKKAKGEIISFLDDDAYPAKGWLERAIAIFNSGSKGKQERIAGVCGPTLTPPSDNLACKASGYVWSTWLGSGGAGTYRCAVSKRREVDDYPSVNLFVRRADFLKVGGFDSHFWPGEDTKLCLDLTEKLKKKIIYDPEVLVYHHRRQVFGPHLKQISRYAIHRGFFARVLPQTSLRLGYFIPSLFFLGLFFIPLFIFILEIFQLCVISIPLLLIYLFCLFLYFLLILATAVKVFFREKNLSLALLLIPSIFITHLVYGALFIKGFFKKSLKSKYTREKI